MLTLTDVLEGTGGLLAPGHEGEVTFARAIIDSREVQAGDLFIPLSGERVDGHDFIPHAIANHAAGILASRPAGAIPNRLAYVQVPNTLEALQHLGRYKLAQAAPYVIGVTGSVGKTSTKEAVAGALGHFRKVLKTEKNYNTEIGVPLSLLRLEPDDEVAVLEMGMYLPGDIRFLAHLTHPSIGIVTSVGHVHAERVGTIEGIAEAKAELIDNLAPNGLAVLNGDDRFARDMAGRTKRKLFFGKDAINDVRATSVRSEGFGGVTFTLVCPTGSGTVHTRAIGAHSVYHFLAAAAVMMELNFSFHQIIEALSAYKPEALRLRVVDAPNSVTVIDDTYNSSPPAAEAALRLLAEMPPGHQHIAVLGDMRELGRYSAELHRQVGSVAAGTCDLLVAVGAEARQIAEGASAAGMEASRIFATSEPDAAVTHLKGQLKPGDYLLIKGSRAMGLETIVEAMTTA